MTQTIYTVGGTVHEGVYIPRKADEELLALCRVSEFAFILSSRQVGKSSLMVRTARQLETEGIRYVIIDLSSIGVNISADEWYLGILNEIANTLELRADIFGWWAERAALSPATRMTNFFRDVLLKEVSQPVVLFFDEIDSTLSIPFKDDFFTALRAIYNARSTVVDFKHLSFVLIGVATPSDLISDSARTPFNIGRRVELTDFTREELNPLAEGLGENAAQVLDWVFDWTNGHPYLTQRLCAYLGRSGFKPDLQQDTVESAKSGDFALQLETVESAVKDLFLGEKGMEDNNLQFVRDMLLERAADKTGVLKIYRQVIQDKKPVEDDEQSLNKSHLKLSGVVRRRQVNLRVSNLIYQNVFGLNWVKEHLPRLERRTVIATLAVVSLLAVTLAGLGVTGYLNKVIYSPMAAEFNSDWADVPAGEFTMGSTQEQVDQAFASCQEQTNNQCPTGIFDDEMPQHQVTLDAYQIMRYEVTNRQYAQCVKNGTCQGGGLEYQDDAGNILNRLNDEAYANHPVVTVSWFQAETYCQWIGARLPTEAEWEKAARGPSTGSGDGRTYPWGENIDCSLANYWGKDGGCVGDTTPVGSYPVGVSPYGVYDMAGNVWEWTSDWYDIYPGGDRSTFTEVETYRVLRGGAWDYSGNDVRSVNRDNGAPGLINDNVGFRCARSLP
jgi:formylglycine-generating enzyme required for sulfatase activity